MPMTNVAYFDIMKKEKKLELTGNVYPIKRFIDD